METELKGVSVSARTVSRLLTWIIAADTELSNLIGFFMK